MLRGQFCILASYCLSPMRRNSVLEQLRVSHQLTHIRMVKQFRWSVSGKDVISWRFFYNNISCVCNLIIMDVEIEIVCTRKYYHI